MALALVLVYTFLAYSLDTKDISDHYYMDFSCRLRACGIKSMFEEDNGFSCLLFHNMAEVQKF